MMLGYVSSVIAAVPSWVSSPAAEKVALALLGAALGFAANYLLDRLKAQREPRKQISWDVAVERAHLKVTDGIQAKVRLFYGTSEVSGLALVRCVVTNTGNRVVKDHQLRFTFPEKTLLLEDYLDPKPDRELAVEQVPSETVVDGCPERLYRIGHFERDESVSFNFVIAGEGQFNGWRPRSFNAEGDVEFVQRDAAVAKDDQAHIRPFLTYGFAAIAIPAALETLPFGFFSDTLLVAMRLALLLMLLPHVLPMARIAERLIGSRLRPSASQTDVRAWGGGTVLVLNGDSQIQGDLSFRPPRADNESKASSDSAEASQPKAASGDHSRVRPH